MNTRGIPEDFVEFCNDRIELLKSKSSQPPASGSTRQYRSNERNTHRTLKKKIKRKHSISIQTITLGPAAAAYAAVLVIAGDEPRTVELEHSLFALVISIPLTVAGYFFFSMLSEIDSSIIQKVLWALGALVANIGHFALVAGIYYFIKNVSPTEAILFLKLGGGVYVTFSLLYYGLYFWHKKSGNDT